MVSSTKWEKRTQTTTFPVQGGEQRSSDNVFKVGINSEPFCLTMCPQLPPHSNEEIKGVQLFQEYNFGRNKNFFLLWLFTKIWCQCLSLILMLINNIFFCRKQQPKKEQTNKTKPKNSNPKNPTSQTVQTRFFFPYSGSFY